MKQTTLYAFFLSLFFSAITAQPLLTIIIPAFNNKAYVTDTLDSIRNQTYQNYRIIYIDDCSTDGSFETVLNYIETYGWHDKIVTIANTKRHRKLRNIYYAIHYLCSDDEVIVFIDCDDKLAHTKALERVAHIMSNESVWFMYGQDKAFPEKDALKWGVSTTNLCSPTSAETIKKNSFRKSMWVYMHIRAFRAWLYKKVELRDLITHSVDGFKGKFYPACNDYANIYPMLEMAGSHIFFNDQLVYLYNAGSPLNGFKVDRTLQVRSAQEIQAKTPYQPLLNPLYVDQSEPTVSIVVRRDDSHAYAINYVLLSNNDLENEMNSVIATQTPQPLTHALQKTANDYVVIINENALKNISSATLLSAICDLKKTHADWIHICTPDQIPNSLVTEYITDGLYAYAGWCNPPVFHAHVHICTRSRRTQLADMLSNKEIHNNDYVGLINLINEHA